LLSHLSTPNPTISYIVYRDKDIRKNQDAMVQSPSSSAATIKYLLNFLKSSNSQPACTPGFSHALKLSYKTIVPDNISVGSKTLTYRYRFGSTDIPKATVGIYTALMDELSTNACVLVGQPSPPGASIQFQTELLDKNFQAVQELDVVNTVTKLGRTIAHTRTDFLCAISGKKLAFSSHIKYMPTGSRLMDWLFTSRRAWDMYMAVMGPADNLPVYKEKELIADVIRNHLEFHHNGRATFNSCQEHVNPFGAMHGGCQAMVIEQAGEAYALAELSCDSVLLHGIQVDFLSAIRESIEVVCEMIGTVDESTIHVRVLFKKEDRILSEGKLRFSIA